MIQKIKNIIKSKTRKNEWEGEWHKERYEICRACPYNSFHTKKGTLKWWFFNIANGFKVFCTICGCGIKDKTSIEIEECALKKIGKTPKWTKYEYN